MRWLIVGGKGMLGTDLAQLLRDRKESVKVLDRPEIDITNVKSVTEQINDTDIVVNTAAFTAVDPAEENEAAAFAVNATGPEILARRCADLGVRLVQISTDYVFAGDAETPYPEGAVMAPKSAYGRTKAAGEWAVRTYTDDYLIIRTAWLYGAYGNCFPKTMAKLSDAHEQLSVVTDEWGQPTWTVDLANLIINLVEAKAPAGVYHGTASGSTNWHGFTKEIVKSYGKDPAMVGETTAAAFNRPAPRPHYSVLGHQALNRIGVKPIGDWRERWQMAAPVIFSHLD
ncbi:dTDP-4-dehydrorhamnose reductase [Varibaculum cambriense]|uniref:dTDP-4-dehydrorhamnose reductase n=1 Tax=Varibaculum cambriense TaxID=184870 RepID=UPI000C7DE3D2|nr:dTDP-4-dehydrorhamnose reductase [Varibaculum cambriense]